MVSSVNRLMSGFVSGVVATVLLAGWSPLTRAEDAAPAANPAHGAKIAYTCFGCHGITNYRTSYPVNYHVPKIGGQRAAYMVAALGEYRSGARAHATMKAQAGSMSEQDMRDLAAYFATDKPLTAAGTPIGTAPAAAQVCTSCHGQTGVGIIAEYPTLAGQHPDYIEQALKAYRKGTRQNAIMNGFAANLKDEDIHAIARYFAAQNPALWTPAPPHRP
jgi:cytochrome c553